MDYSKLKKMKVLQPLKGAVYAYRRRKNRRYYRWMLKQKNMVDPAQDKRPKYWLKCGVNSVGDFRVGYGVYFDAINADKITIEDGVWIAAECLFLCHRRILDDYHSGICKAKVC